MRDVGVAVVGGSSLQCGAAAAPATAAAAAAGRRSQLTLQSAAPFSVCGCPGLKVECERGEVGPAVPQPEQRQSAQ